MKSTDHLQMPDAYQHRVARSMSLMSPETGDDLKDDLVLQLPDGDITRCSQRRRFIEQVSH